MSEKQTKSHVPELSEPSSSSSIDDPPLVYANDVRVVVESGRVQLIFTLSLPSETGTDEPTRPADADHPESEVIARVVLSSLAIHRLLRLLPGRLAEQPEITSSNRNDNETDDLKNEPFLATLAAAELDDEPYTDQQRAAALAGWEACKRGETVSWEDVRRSLLDENEAAKISTS